MKIQVYGDIVFLINFCMDYILLAFMCKIMVCNSGRLRRTIAAAAGGAGAIAAFYLPAWCGVPLQLALGVLMCRIAARYTTLRHFLSALAVFYGSALIFGGGTLAFGCAVGADVLVKNGAFYIDMSIGILTIAAIICSALLFILEKLLRHTKADCRRRVTIGFMERRITLRGYVDTGNTLTSGGLPVILVPWSSAAPLFPENTCENNFFTKCPPERVRSAAYKSVNGGGIIWCIIPDYIYVGDKTENALVGIVGRSLSPDYDALLYALM